MDCLTRQFVHPFPRTELCAGATFGSALQNWQREEVPLEDAFKLTSAVCSWDEPPLCCFTFFNATDELLFQVVLSVSAMPFYI